MGIYKGGTIMDLKESQKRVLKAIKDYIDENGYSPSFRELGKIANINSSATVQYHINKLKEKGYIDYIPNQRRTIRIIKEFE